MADSIIRIELHQIGEMYCLPTAKTIGIPHFLLESYKTTRTKIWDAPVFCAVGPCRNADGYHLQHF